MRKQVIKIALCEQLLLLLLQFLVLLPQLARAALKHFNNPFAGAVALPVKVVVQCCMPCEWERRGILDVTASFCCSFSLC